MFQKLDPRKRKYVSLLQPDGRMKNPDGLPVMPEADVIKAFRIMTLAREADEWAVNLNRQGRMPTYPSNKGQEANAVGALMAVRQDDWFVPSHREIGAWLARGVPLSQVYLYWYGNERSNFLAPETYHTLPVAIPVGSQPVHAVGLAYAEKMKRSGRIALTFMGEGATSQGVVHEAFNLAGVWQVGVVFYIQNNQWAISLPTSRQTASSTLAEKAFGYGYEGIRLDGNDLFAVYAGVTMATEVAREKGSPVLIEGYTYRLGAHTTSDDPDRYRDSSEVEVWLKRDPLIRLEKYLLTQGLLSESDCDDVREEAKAEAKRAFEDAESTPDPLVEDTFEHVFAALPISLRNQLEKRKNGWAH